MKPRRHILPLKPVLNRELFNAHIVVLVCLFFYCSLGTLALGELKGDPELLRQAVELNRSNWNRIKTWCGTVQITNSNEEDGVIERVSVSFSHDISRRFLHWNWEQTYVDPVVLARLIILEDGSVHLREPETLIGLIQNDRRYLLRSRSVIHKSGSRHSSVVISPIKWTNHRGHASEVFNPKWIVTQAWGLDIESRFDGTYKNAANPRLNWSVARKGDTVSLASHDGTSRYDVDLSKGGNPIRIEYSRDGSISRWEMDWQKVDDTWLPLTCEHSYPLETEGRKRQHTRRMEWREQVVNKELAPDQFAPGILPLKPGDLVTNRIPGEPSNELK